VTFGALHWNLPRSAPCGSEARTATANSVAITPETTTGSRGLVPESIDWQMRVRAKRNSKPRPNSALDENHRTSSSIACKLIALRPQAIASS
jgi:hypothetical protein